MFCKLLAAPTATTITFDMSQLIWVPNAFFFLASRLSQNKSTPPHPHLMHKQGAIPPSHSITPSITPSLTHSPPPTHPLTHSFTHSPPHALTHSFAHSPTHSLTHFLSLSLSFWLPLSVEVPSQPSCTYIYLSIYLSIYLYIYIYIRRPQRWAGGARQRKV